jgi:hypothetical protein
MTQFSPNSVAGCIDNVECRVGGSFELRQTIKQNIYKNIFYIVQLVAKKNGK